MNKRLFVVTAVLLLIAVAAMSLNSIVSVGQSLYNNTGGLWDEESWIRKASMPWGGAVFGAEAVNGKIYAFGGYSYNGTFYSTSGAYDPATDTWTSKAEMPTPRVNFATAMYQDKIYVIGGQEKSDMDPGVKVVEVYDPATNAWTAAASMLEPRVYMQAEVVNGKIYVIGGQPNPYFPPYNTNTTQVYDPKMNSWSLAASAPFPLKNYASVVVEDKIFIMAGFFGGEGYPLLGYDTMYIYNSATDEWSLGAQLPQAVSNAFAGATTGVMAPKAIYLFGGFNHVGQSQVYDPETTVWIIGGSVPQSIVEIGMPTSMAATAVLNDAVYVMGGMFYVRTVFPGPEKIPTLPPPEHIDHRPYFSFNYEFIPFGYGTFESTPSPTPWQEKTLTRINNYSLILIVALIIIVCVLLFGLLIKHRKSHYSDSANFLGSG